MVKLPEDIQRDMNRWRAGEIWNLPQSYIDFHENIAREDAEKQDWVILEDLGLMDEGWGDGMKVLHLVVAVKIDLINWKVYHVRWHNQGSWFRINPFGGSSIFRKIIL
jgi:hypothetical protein